MRDKVALVTGAASGIGSATAAALGRDGARVLVCDIAEDAGNRVTQTITAAGGLASFFHLDVREAARHLLAVEEAQRLYGGLDIAVNCAGISVGSSGVQRPVHEVDVQDWLQILDVNVNGMFYGIKAQVPAMRARGGGSIVNVGSVMSVVARTQLSAYVASKHAVLGLTKAAALDCAPHGIRVNSVGPGYVDTPLLAGKDDQTRRAYAELHPLNRMATAQEVAGTVLWLSGDSSSFSTGAHYAVDGGYTVQ